MTAAPTPVPVSNAPIVARVAPFALFIGFLALGDVLAWLAPASAAPATANWLSVARGIAVGLLLLAFIPRYTELAAVKKVRASEWALGAVVGALVVVAWIALDRPAFRLGEATGGFVPLREDGTLDLVLVCLRLIGLVVVVPVMEELFWRSFLMRWLTQTAFLGFDPRGVSYTAFLITAGLFAAAHDLWLAGLVAGAAYGWLYVRTGMLWVPIAAHALTNGALGAYILCTGAWHLW